ncbi:ABC transporter substrate-binding protein [Nonomuraea sp. NPDC049480]|uniref:ABC transporter substrate-binding protein n=1 Tax=Nonomuraea sp. NPDC049480 TaxID=3364353 RepID=UPI0037AFEF73
MSQNPTVPHAWTGHEISRRALLSGFAVTGAAALTGCAALTPGASSTPAANAGPISTALPADKKITLKVADADDTSMTPGLLAAFQKKYPNVTFDRQYTGWDDYLKSINLTMSSSTAPDIAQFTPGMQNLIPGGLLLDVSAYGTAYGWPDKFPGLDQITFEPDGKTVGTGKLYGVPGGLSFEGVYYNKTKAAKLGLTVPAKTVEELEALFAKAKAAGELALVAGNLDGGLNHPFNELLSVYLKPEDREAWAFGHKGATIVLPEAKTAATTLKRWVDEGYISRDVNGISDNDATAGFAKGKGVFRISGNWAAAAVAKGLGDNAGYFSMPQATADSKIRTTGAGVYYCVSSKSANAAAAAAFLDFVGSDEAAKITAEAGFMAPKADAMPGKTGLIGALQQGWQDTVRDKGLQPFIQNASTPTMGDTLTTQLQLLAGGKVTVDAFLANIQADFDNYHK